MRPPFVLDFECTDDTGRYITSVLCTPKNHMIVIKYLDFPNMVQICAINEKQSIIKNMIRTLFSQEGVIPRVKYYGHYYLEDMG